MKFFKEEGYTPTSKIGIFDKQQLSAILICVFAGAALIFIMSGSAYDINMYIYRTLALINLFFLLNRQAVKKFLLKDYDARTILPLHLCSLNLLLICAAAFTFSDTLLNYVFAASPIPAMCALIFPEADAARFPKFNLRCIEYYTCHTLLILLPVIPVLYLGFKPRISSFFICLVIFYALLGVIALINMKLKSNYMYICYGPEHTPLKTLEKKVGKKIYRLCSLPFFAALFFIMNGMYLLFS